MGGSVHKTTVNVCGETVRADRRSLRYAFSLQRRLLGMEVGKLERAILQRASRKRGGRLGEGQGQVYMCVIISANSSGVKALSVVVLTFPAVPKLSSVVIMDSSLGAS